MKDILIVLLLLIVIAASFYAFQLIVLGIVGLIIYLSLPLLRKLSNRRFR